MLTVLILLALATAPPAAPAATSSPPLRVMTFNLRYGTADDGADAWEHRRDFLIDVVRARDPDVLGTQECLSMQRDVLAESLPGYAVIAAGRDDGYDAGEMCALFVRESRLDVLASGHFWLSETPDAVGSRSWDAALCRMATWARVADRQAGGREFLVVNTHWDHVGEEARRQSARLVRRRAAQLAAGAPIIVLGDFNAVIADTAAQAAGRILRAGDGDGLPPLRETFAVMPAARGAPTGTFHAFTGKPQPGCIDGILVTPEWPVLAAAIVDTSRDGRYPSDHFPVTCAVRLP